MQEEPNKYVKELTQEKYKYGFTTDVHTDIIEKGLNEDVIRLISAKKEEPEWLLEFRLKAYRHWLTMEMPTWAHLTIPEIDYQAISYYADPTKKKEGPKSLDEVDPELIKTFNKLGIPLEEQMALSGMAVDAVMDSVSVKTTFKETLMEKGIIFCSFSEAVREHPDLVKKYMGSVVGYVPRFGLLTDEGRKATWIVKIETMKKPEAQLLGSAIGMKVMADVPYIVGLDKWLGGELDDAAKTYLKDFGAATASNGAVGLYHVENITPEAVKYGKDLIAEDAKVYVVDDAELQRVYESYPVIWKKKDAKPKLCFMGCPHMSLQQLIDWTEKVSQSLKEAGRTRVCIPTVFTAAPAVLKKFQETPYAETLKATGVITSYICPLMYMNNPLSEKMPVITSSNKLRTYTSARYYTDAEILEQITKGGADR